MTMEQNEPRKLASLIKGVHKQLRRHFRENEADYDSIWASHTQDQATLQSYADAMKALASNHWTDTDNPESRINWCYQTMQEYYVDGGLTKARRKDAKHEYFERLRNQQLSKDDTTQGTTMQQLQTKQHENIIESAPQVNNQKCVKCQHSDMDFERLKMDPFLQEGGSNSSSSSSSSNGRKEFTLETEKPISTPVGDNRLTRNEKDSGSMKGKEEAMQDVHVTNKDKSVDDPLSLMKVKDSPSLHNRPIQVLDVGSCYNPFSVYPDLQPLAIDLCPADDSVLQCDFINLEIRPPDCRQENTTSLTTHEANPPSTNTNLVNVNINPTTNNITISNTNHNPKLNRISTEPSPINDPNPHTHIDTDNSIRTLSAYSFNPTPTNTSPNNLPNLKPNPHPNTHTSITNQGSNLNLNFNAYHTPTNTSPNDPNPNPNTKPHRITYTSPTNSNRTLPSYSFNATQTNTSPNHPDPNLDLNPNPYTHTNTTHSIRTLPSCSFDVVVFCLLLEYLPSPAHRVRCCIHAARLLHDHGLLMIVTPDSSNGHNRNAPMMKAWRSALGKLGLVRWKYHKLQHIHCMAFRKTSSIKIEDVKRLETELADSMYIPQDFSDACYKDKDPVSKTKKRGKKVTAQNDEDEVEENMDGKIDGFEDDGFMGLLF